MATYMTRQHAVPIDSGVSPIPQSVFTEHYGVLSEESLPKTRPYAAFGSVDPPTDTPPKAEALHRSCNYNDIVSPDLAKRPEHIAPAARRRQEDQPFTSKETLLLFDWDDTVLPTTWLRERGLVAPGLLLSRRHREELDDVARSAVRLLQVAKQYGTVVFVTNAQAGWIEHSCLKYLPSLLPHLEDGVKIYSARSTYEPHGISCPFEWKFLAFLGQISNHYSREPKDARQNVVSIGDSLYEREALLRVGRERQQDYTRVDSLRTKCVKLVETPTIPQLTQEHELLADNLSEFVHHPGNLQLLVGN